MDEIFKLNVGGTTFTTSRMTLCAEPASMLAAKFKEDGSFAPPLKDEDGNIFLDRNPAYFMYVLDFLRSGCSALPDAPAEVVRLEAIKTEADYFGLSGLVKICDSKISAASENAKVEHKVVTLEYDGCEGDTTDNADLKEWTEQGYHIKDITSATRRWKHYDCDSMLMTFVLEKKLTEN